MTESQRRTLMWVAVGFVAFVVFGNQGFRDMASKSREKNQLDDSLKNLRAERERLSHELSWLKQDPGYSEYLVRKNLGYVKKGEVEYRFVRGEKKQ